MHKIILSGFHARCVFSAVNLQTQMILLELYYAIQSFLVIPQDLIPQNNVQTDE